VWKNEAFGTTYEPLAFVYNKRLLSGDEIPQSHADLPSAARRSSPTSPSWARSAATSKAR
jgi:ABC-type Fe3+ transport system substrate-binding protein